MRIIKQFLAILLCESVLFSATITVCPTGCTTNSLQAALDTLAACGDTIQIQTTTTQTGNYLLHYRACTSGTPITVTSDRAATWLSNPNARVTPSQFLNTAVIQTPNSNPALQGVLDSMSRPPAHWKFYGISFTTTAGTFDLVGFNVNGEATASSMIADDITFDHDLFGFAPTYNGSTDIQDVMRADVTNLVIKNSYVGDSFYNGYIESHGFRALTTAGPITITNSFITTSTIPIFSGGATPSYAVYLNNGLTAKYNYFWRPGKYNGDPASPYAAQYVAWAQNTCRTGACIGQAPFVITNVTNTGIITVPPTSSWPGGAPWIPASLLSITGVGGCTVANTNNWRIAVLSSTTFQLLNFPGCNSAYTSGGTVNEFGVTVCQKNLGELKYGIGIDWEYNGGENTWFSQSGCQSQYTGFTDTFRTQWDSNGNGTATTGTVTMADTTHISWAGPYTWAGPQAMGNGQANIGDNAMCIRLSTGTECHPVTVTTGATSAVATTPFSSTAVNPTVWFVYTGSGELQNVTIAHNIWKNTDSWFNVQALSFANGVGNAGHGDNQSIHDNLLYINNSYVSGWKGFNVSSAEADDVWKPFNWCIDHNTLYTPFGLAHDSFVYLNGNGISGAFNTPFDSGCWTNNLFGVSSTSGIAGDGVATIGDVANNYYTNSNFKNNAVPGGTIGPAGTSGNVNSGNQVQAWVDPFGGGAANNIFIVQSGSMYFNAGTDGKSLGADWQLLPMVTGIAVSGATLKFNVNNQNNDVKNTQPVVLEVSTSPNLQTDVGNYSVISSVDPTITPGADLSTRSDVTVSGNAVTWPLGTLSVGTTYYVKIMAYGDTEWFSFVATSSASATTRSGHSVGAKSSVIH